MQYTLDDSRSAYASLFLVNTASNVEPIAPSTELVVFSCEGRAQLLRQTIDSFGEACTYDFDRRILALDGQLDARTVEYARPDTVVQNYRRSGYISNIINALDVIDSEYFFWLEDDWRFPEAVDAERLVAMMQGHEDWVQVRISKRRALRERKRGDTPIEEGVFESMPGFSGNPCLCRTTPMRNAFEALQNAARSEDAPDMIYERFVTQWCAEHDFTCAVLDPQQTGMQVAHNGALERTNRKMLNVASFDEVTRDETSRQRVGTETFEPSFLQRVTMVPKLFRACFRISLKLFWNANAYLVAFRMSVIDEDEL